MSSEHDVVLIDVNQAASIAGRTPETVRRWVRSGRRIARRDGRRMLLARDDVLRLSGKAPDVSALSLDAWAQLPRPTGGAGETTASDLVLADRAVRETGPGSAG